MKLRPPEVEIKPDNPFKHALFARKQFGDSLTALLRTVTDNLVIFVNAPWGEGKSTFARMWRAELERLKLQTIYFDAYAADYFNDPFVCFTGEILELLEKRFPECPGVSTPRREFKKAAIEVGKRLGGLLVKTGIKAATLGIVDSQQVSEYKEVISDAVSGVSEIAGDVVVKQIECYTAEKDSLKRFKESLAKVATAVREQQGFPLTIIVDELDRCRPDFALNLLERLKHLFNVEGVAFVLLVNREQIETYIRTVYGNSVDARAYLLKFANLFVDLPTRQTAYDRTLGRDDYCRILFDHHCLSELVQEPAMLQRWVKAFAEHFQLSLREIERVFTTLVLAYSSSPNSERLHEFLGAILAVLKVTRPAIYERLRTSNISANEFFDGTGLKHFRQNNDINWMWGKNVLSICLMTEAELEQAKTSDQDSGEFGQWGITRLLESWGRNRSTLIPFLCSRLDAFSVQPQ